MKRFALAAAPIDVLAWQVRLQRPGCGGVCSFEGRVRDLNEGRAVDGLDYEAYPELALAEGERILDEAIARFGVQEVLCVHRTGSLVVGELAIWIGVAAAHRDEAFRACRYVIDEIKRRVPIWKKEHYVDGATEWVACHHAHDDGSRAPHGREPHAFVPDYSRQWRLREVGEEGQGKLRSARVLVIGAGGLGAPAISYLAGAGVGTLGIVDGDRLEASNLHRQVIYRAVDVGQPKVALARAHVAALNPSVRVITYERPLDAAAIAGVFADYDLVLECTDDLHSRYLCNDAALATGTPLVLASVYQYEGQLQVVSGAATGPCLRCLWPEEPAQALAGTCQASGVLGPVPGVLGTLQAAEALKWLLGLSSPAQGALVLINLLDLTMQRLPLDSAACRARGGCAQVARRHLGRVDAIDLDVARLDALLAGGAALVDVREPDEVAAVPLPRAAHAIPVGALLAGTLPATDGALVLVCASGRRSGLAARALRERGIEAFSLVGGLAGWRAEADGGWR